ncbi:MAG: hypothetical protein ABL898_05155 [Hyphomicrobiaceae bacterium]
MGIEALTKAAMAAGFAMAPIEDTDDVAVAAATIDVEIKGEAVARGQRTPKQAIPVKSILSLPAPTDAVRQTLSAGQSVGQSVYGYVFGRGVTA